MPKKNVCSKMDARLHLFKLFKGLCAFSEFQQSSVA